MNVVFNWSGDECENWAYMVLNEDSEVRND